MYDSLMTRPIENAIDLLEKERDPRVGNWIAARHHFGEGIAMPSFGDDGIGVGAEPLSIQDTRHTWMVDMQQVYIGREVRQAVVVPGVRRLGNGNQNLDAVTTPSHVSVQAICTA